MRNEPERDPTSSKPFSSRHLREACRAGPSGSAVRRATRRPRRREGEWLIGMGCATATYPYYRMPGGAARITLSKGGHVRIDVPSHEMGMGIATVHEKSPPSGSAWRSSR